MNGLKKAALKLASLNPDDKAWILARLSGSASAQIEQEINELPPMAGLSLSFDEVLQALDTQAPLPEQDTAQALSEAGQASQRFWQTTNRAQQTTRLATLSVASLACVYRQLDGEQQQQLAEALSPEQLQKMKRFISEASTRPCNAVYETLCDYLYDTGESWA